MRVSNLVLAIVSLVVLATTFTAECGGSTKGGTDGTPKRASRSVSAELAAAATTVESDVSNNETIARSMQEEENKKQAEVTNGSMASGAPSSEYLARILHEEEEKKACAPRNDSSSAKKTNKRSFQPRTKAKGSSDITVIADLQRLG